MRRGAWREEGRAWQQAMCMVEVMLRSRPRVLHVEAALGGRTSLRVHQGLTPYIGGSSARPGVMGSSLSCGLQCPSTPRSILTGLPAVMPWVGWQVPCELVPCLRGLRARVGAAGAPEYGGAYRFCDVDITVRVRVSTQRLTGSISLVPSLSLSSRWR